MLLPLISKSPEPSRSLKRVELNAAMNGWDPEPRKSITASAGLPPPLLTQMVMSCANSVAVRASIATTNKKRRRYRLLHQDKDKGKEESEFRFDIGIIVLVGTGVPRLRHCRSEEHTSE